MNKGPLSCVSRRAKKRVRSKNLNVKGKVMTDYSSTTTRQYEAEGPALQRNLYNQRRGERSDLPYPELSGVLHRRDVLGTDLLLLAPRPARKG